MSSTTIQQTVPIDDSAGKQLGGAHMNAFSSSTTAAAKLGNRV
jgi:hypothetical protein